MMSPVDITQGYTPSLDAASARTSYLVNWRVDAAGTNIPRPRLQAQSMTGMNSGTTVIGLYVFKDRLIVVGSDRYVYYVNWATPTVAVPISTSTAKLTGSARPVFTEDASDLFITDGGYYGWKWTPGNPTISAILTTPINPNATHIAWLGQRLVANSRGTTAEKSYYYWSDAGDGSDGSWPAANYASPEADPDELSAIYVNASWLWLFGPKTLQTFSVGSDATNPWDSVASVRVGLGAIYSPIRYDGTFVFLDETGRVVRSDGRNQSPQDLGSDITADIQSMTTFTDAWGWRQRSHSYDTIGFNFPTAQRTFERDMNTGKWSELAYYDPAQGLMQTMPISTYAYWQKLGLHVFGRSDTNDIAVMNETTGLELGGELMCRRTINNVDHRRPSRKRSNGVRMFMRRGTVAQGTTPGVVELRINNDGDGWTEWEQRSVGNAGDYIQKVDFHSTHGVFYQRDYDVRYAGSDATSIVSMFDDIVEVGT